MRALIAVTCVVLIAAVGHYFWREFRAASERAAVAETIEDARLAIYRMSGATPGDRIAAGRWCDQMRKLVRGELKDNYVAVMRVQQCRLLGL